MGKRDSCAEQYRLPGLRELSALGAKVKYTSHIVTPSKTTSAYIMNHLL